MSSIDRQDLKKITGIRYGMLWFAVIGTFLIGIRHLLPGEAGSGGSFDAFCPFGAIETLWVYLARGQTLKTTNLLNFAVMSGVLGVSIVAGRAFCGWMCPLGAVQEWLAKMARRLGGEKRHIRGKPAAGRLPIAIPLWADRPLRWAKYLLLGLVLAASAFAVYPPLHDICPVRAVFSFRLETGLLWSVLGVFLVTSFLMERSWCKYLCPLGATLAIFNKISPVRIVSNASRCNNCGRCDFECSMGIQSIPENLRDAECIRCLECLETCAQDESLKLKVL
ncbi:MAG: 4Fe-4S binding protein [Anaerolineales bacterium]